MNASVPPSLSASARVELARRLAGFDILEFGEVLEHEHAGIRHRLLRHKLRLAGHQPLAVRRLARLEGPTRGSLVLVHGLAQNRRTWRVRGRSLEAALAARGYEVFNLELRGHGHSGRLGSRPAGGLRDYVEDIRRMSDALLEPAVYLGHSLGAGVLVRAAARGVEMAGLVHIAGVYTFGLESRLLQTAARLTQTLPFRRVPARLGVWTRPAGQMIASYPRLSELVNARVPFSGWAPGSMEPEVLAERFGGGFDKVGFGVWRDMADLPLGGELDPDGAFASWDRPLLVLAGQADGLAVPNDAIACHRDSRSRDKSLVIFDEARHGYAPGHVDIILGRRAPEVVWPVLFDWLSETKRWR